MSTKRKLLLLCLTISVSLLFGDVFRTAQASSADPPMFSKEWNDLRFDWVITLDAQMLKNYFRTTGGSKLNEMAIIRSKYRINPRLAPGRVDKTTLYEYLWFHQHKPVGCRRVGTIKMDEGWQGMIYIPPSPDGHDYAPSQAAAIVRYLVEVASKGGILTVVLAPSDLVARICDELGHFSFYRTSDDEVGSGPSAVYLFVASGPKTDRTNMVFKPGR